MGRSNPIHRLPSSFLFLDIVASYSLPPPLCNQRKKGQSYTSFKFLLLFYCSSLFPPWRPPCAHERNRARNEERQILGNDADDDRWSAHTGTWVALDQRACFLI
ncbi:hypothetical protein BDP55DRAFT_657274 [Colletotrichum godetiae]|uniref:Uncharacterized protein n=1 Tax=Colletotrichum godetiae TaxID=1209918 RepID=A0AAJ0ASX9_9PEZI|nr:uncharacterized protein BDP55DRAFT_657274 [Colletotrichum godetiae]KAK1688250.1 hypothetical protein BDP55DRAFT_657274 [Colletotrichum godetiae]